MEQAEARNTAEALEALTPEVLIEEAMLIRCLKPLKLQQQQDEAHCSSSLTTLSLASRTSLALSTCTQWSTARRD